MAKSRSDMGDKNFNSILPLSFNSKLLQYFGWSSEGSENFKNFNIKTQNLESISNSIELHKTYSGSEDLNLLKSVKSYRRDKEDSTISLNSDSCNTTTANENIGIIKAVVPVKEPCGITLHPLLRNVLYIQKENVNTSFISAPMISKFQNLQSSEIKKSECTSACIKEIMPNPFRRNSSSPPLVTPTPPQVLAPEWTHHMEQVWIKFAESLPSTLRNQTTLNITITIGFTLISWLFLSWLTQLIVSFICVSAAVFFLSAILSPETNSWFVANFLLTNMSNLRYSLSDIFLKLGMWLSPPNHEIQRQNIYRNENEIQHQNRSQNRRNTH